uniref:Uncharacterized protein n=1 Tax=Setaria viridis TaxID=4556 RepID=A0A4U6TVS6_SETVI|nr:hypothetical protein SEVIR_7G237033v2 [Setaria viridis]
MVQYPPGPVEEAPVAPTFDLELVRDFFHFLLTAVQGEDPETSRVTNFVETASLGLNYRHESGLLVITPSIIPIIDAIPMAKFLRKMTTSGAQNLVKYIKSKGLVEGDELKPPCNKLIEVSTKVDEALPEATEAALLVSCSSCAGTRWPLPRSLQSRWLKSTRPRHLAPLEAKVLHRTVKNAYRDTQILLKVTPVDLPDLNPFDV